MPFLIIHMSISYAITGTVTYGLFGRSSPKSFSFPNEERVFSLEELRAYDGTNPNKPILISIKGEVYDVTKGRRFYGPGGGYHIFAGRDATRAFLNGCFDEASTGATYDLRGLTNEQIEGLATWIDFYRNHDEYKYVGRAVLPEIPSDTPIPDDDC